MEKKNNKKKREKKEKKTKNNSVLKGFTFQGGKKKRAGTSGDLSRRRVLGTEEKQNLPE